MKTLFTLALLVVGPVWAQTAVPYPLVGELWHQPMVFVPNSATAITSSDTLLMKLHLANTTGSAVTVTLTDNSTACGGSACQFWPAISIAANTVYENDFGGILCVGGVKWSSNAASAVVGWAKGNYARALIAQNGSGKSQHSVFHGLALALGIRKAAPRMAMSQPEEQTFGSALSVFPH